MNQACLHLKHCITTDGVVKSQAPFATVQQFPSFQAALLAASESFVTDLLDPQKIFATSEPTVLSALGHLMKLYLFGKQTTMRMFYVSVCGLSCIQNSFSKHTGLRCTLMLGLTTGACCIFIPTMSLLKHRPESKPRLAPQLSTVPNISKPDTNPTVGDSDPRGACCVQLSHPE